MLLLAGLQLSSRLELAQKGLPADRALLAPAPPDGQGVERLALAPDHDIRDLGELGVADLPPKRLLPFVHRSAEALPAQVVGERLGGGRETFGDRKDAHLFRGEDEREVAARVLQIDPDEA